jgi:hypothetical protein
MGLNNIFVTSSGGPETGREWSHLTHTVLDSDKTK